MILILLYLLLEAFIFKPESQRPVCVNTVEAICCMIVTVDSVDRAFPGGDAGRGIHTSFPSGGRAADTPAFRFYGGVEGM